MAPAAGLLPAIFFTSIPRFRSGVIRRVAARSLIRWHGQAATDRCCSGGFMPADLCRLILPLSILTKQRANRQRRKVAATYDQLRNNPQHNSASHPERSEVLSFFCDVS